MGNSLEQHPSERGDFRPRKGQAQQVIGFPKLTQHGRRCDEIPANSEPPLPGELTRRQSNLSCQLSTHGHGHAPEDMLHISPDCQLDVIHALSRHN
jgi:hypothetical protein